MNNQKLNSINIYWKYIIIGKKILINFLFVVKLAAKFANNLFHILNADSLEFVWQLSISIFFDT